MAGEQTIVAPNKEMSVSFMQQTSNMEQETNTPKHMFLASHESDDSLMKAD